ncbi:hypothetical protein NCS52_00771800 [Fusarium sp. LHS14.1]|nr:hypothetical protein NCS52_00771800 [Fusarium sp. LHS14.1]
MAEGGDLAIYNANKFIIQNLLEHSGIPESDHKLWIGIYRIGTSQDQARPAIVVSCLDPRVRRQAKGSIKNCNAQVHELASTITSSTCQPEEHSNPGPEGDIRENIEHQIVLQLFGSYTGDSYLCRPVQACQGLQKQSATAGPLILLEGTMYQLTVEHVVNFGCHETEPSWDHTNDDDWDDDDDDDDTRGHGYVEDMVPSYSDAVRTMSEGSVSSKNMEIDFSDSSSSSSAQEIEGNTSWSPIVPASTPTPQSCSDPRTVGHIIVNDHSSSPQIEPISSPTRCYTSAKMDYLLFPVHVNPAPEVCATGGAEIVQPSDVFDVHGQTEARPVTITTASLDYVQGIIFPASTLLQKPGPRSFQPLFCIKSAFPMPKGTSGSAVFDSQTGLLVGYIVLGCPGKHTCYMVPMFNVLAELNLLSNGIVQCQVQLNMSAIAKMDSDKRAMTRFSPLSSLTPREECNVQLGLSSLERVPGIFSKTTDQVEENPKAEKISRNPPKFQLLRGNLMRFISATLEWISSNYPDNDEWIIRLKLAGKPSWLPWCRPNYPRILDCRGLYQVLRQKRFRDDARDDTTGHPRRIYIDKPNGSSVLALIGTTPASQVEGFRKLFASYVTPTPEPEFYLRESDWWGGCFILSFNLPFFGITTQQQADLRTIYNEKKPFRSRRSLSFLDLNSERLGRPEVADGFYPDPVLHEAVCSLMVTGKSDRYWTAVFLDDDFFDEEPRLTTDEETFGWHTDPIILKDEMKTASPRAYALAALAVALDKIVEHHLNIQDYFQASLSHHTSDNPSDISPADGIHEWMRKFQGALEPVRGSTSNLVRKLDHFLSEDVILGIDGLPLGVLWRSLQSQPDALRSLLRIKQYRDKLRDVESEFLQLNMKASNEDVGSLSNRENAMYLS